MLQFADIYDAPMSARCYKIAISEEALRVMRPVRNAEQWHDAQVMRESLKNLESSIPRS